MRIFLIGDIHGWVDPLVELLKAVEFSDEDTLISIGDIVDRGPDVYMVVEELMKIKNIILIQGNHDIWFKEYLSTKISNPTWWTQGGRETFSSYERRNWKNLSNHINFFNRQIPYFIDDKNRCFVHGGFNHKISIKNQSSRDLAWDRNLVKLSMVENIISADNFSDIFIGHTPTIYWEKDNRDITTPIYSGGVFNIDTGCGKGGPLTILNVDTMEYLQSWPKY